jgi:hypothetical protein
MCVLGGAMFTIRSIRRVIEVKRRAKRMTKVLV